MGTVYSTVNIDQDCNMVIIQTRLIIGRNAIAKTIENIRVIFQEYAVDYAAIIPEDDMNIIPTDEGRPVYVVVGDLCGKNLLGVRLFNTEHMGANTVFRLMEMLNNL